jgi:hypothetical protein
MFSAPTTGHITRHVRDEHRLVWTQFDSLKLNTGNFNVLQRTVQRLSEEADKKIEKATRNQLKFEKLANPDTGLPEKVKSNLILLSWSIANVVGRLALNCPLFDAYLKSIGSTPASNRHDLAAVYLPQLDSLVSETTMASLRGIFSASISCDGWRSRTRRDFINITVQYTGDVDLHWGIIVTHLDLVYVPGSCTAEHLEMTVLGSADEFVRFCLFFHLF